MKRTFILLTTLVVGFPIFAQSETPPESASGSGHEVFLGQVKPVLYVSDVKASARFFQDVLGFEFLGFAGKEESPYYAEMSAGGLKFGLHQPQNDRDRERVGKQKIYFRVRSAESHRSWVLSHGGDPEEIKKTDWMTMFTVRDPDGHDIVFAETDYPAVHKTNPW